MRFGLLLPAKHFATRVRTRHRRRRVLNLHVIVSIHSTEIQFPANIARPFGIARAVSQFVIVSIAGGSESPLATDDHSASVRLFFGVSPFVLFHVSSAEETTRAESAKLVFLAASVTDVFVHSEIVRVRVRFLALIAVVRLSFAQMTIHVLF